MQSATVLIESSLKNANCIRLAFVNANLANAASANPELHQKLQSFLLLNDGSGINIASNILYKERFADNLNGTDFLPYFLTHCDMSLRIFLLGATPIVSSKVAQVVSDKWPKHNVVGAMHGFFRKAEDDQVIGMIKEANPDVVLIAMGNGPQEYWADKLASELNVSSFGVGALFDFLCDVVPRAPVWMRRLGVEWVYRLYLEPSRLWKRYLIGNFKFLYLVMKQLLCKSIKHSQ